MKFKKNDKWTSDCGKKGNTVVIKRHGKLGRVFKKNDSWSIECRKKSHETRRKLGHYEKMGRLSRERENRTAMMLRKKYKKLWMPQEVCDRIAFKNGKLVFIEIKRYDGKLTKNQENFRKLIGKSYIVIRSP